MQYTLINIRHLYHWQQTRVQGLQSSHKKHCPILSILIDKGFTHIMSPRGYFWKVWQFGIHLFLLRWAKIIQIYFNNWKYQKYKPGLRRRPILRKWRASLPWPRVAIATPTWQYTEDPIFCRSLMDSEYSVCDVASPSEDILWRFKWRWTLTSWFHSALNGSLSQHL